MFRTFIGGAVHLYAFVVSAPHALKKILMPTEVLLNLAYFLQKKILKTAVLSVNYQLYQSQSLLSISVSG